MTVWQGGFDMTSKFESRLRFLLPCVLVLGTGIFLQTHTHGENIPPRDEFSQFPSQIGGWSAKEVIIPEDVRHILGAGDFTERIYSNPASAYSVDLFLAYFPTQRTGSTIHSPQHCLPGAGWMPVENRPINIASPQGRPAFVNRYVIAKGLDKELVLYWFQSHGRVVSSEYWARFYLVADSIRMGRSDGSLVRIVTAIGYTESVQSAQARAVEFAHMITPVLAGFIPR
jgi:EpsI family protein